MGAQLFHLFPFEENMLHDGRKRSSMKRHNINVREKYFSRKSCWKMNLILNMKLDCKKSFLENILSYFAEN